MSLYNEERPGRFTEVLGQEITVRQMKRKLAEGRFPQTALLTGPRGTGKTTCARIIAKALNCERPGKDGEPCCECASCLAVDKGASPAVIEMDAATRSGVDDVRSLIAESAYVPAGNRKVFILDEVHMFSTAAWNALLKTLEEPPRDATFLLATTELHKVPATVLSRCVRFEFRTIPKAVLLEHLKGICAERGVKAEEGALGLIARASDGCARDALSLLEQFLGFEEVGEETVRECLGVPPADAAYDLLDAIAAGNLEAALSVVGECEDRGRSLLLFTKSVLETLTDALSAKATGRDGGERQRALVASCGEARLAEMSDAFLAAYPVLAKNERLSFYLKAAVTGLVSTQSALSRLEARVGELSARLSDACASALQKGEETQPARDQEPAGEPKEEPGDLVQEAEEPAEAPKGPAVAETREPEAATPSEPQKVIAFARPFEGDGDFAAQGSVPGFDDWGGEASLERLGDDPPGDALQRGLTEEDLMELLGDDTGGEKGHDEEERGGRARSGAAYEAESDDDPNAAFDFFMAGGSARR